LHCAFSCDFFPHWLQRLGGTPWASTEPNLRKNGDVGEALVDLQSSA
jgi:hypothetical protein